MSEAVVWLTIFVLSVFVGIEVISKVSSTLHTPLMSGANAIHGIILLGAILVTGTTAPLPSWSDWWRSCSRRSTWSAVSW
jgi:NAD/NADP transhydrogenase alpha subunit